MIIILCSHVPTPQAPQTCKLWPIEIQITSDKFSNNQHRICMADLIAIIYMLQQYFFKKFIVIRKLRV